MLKLMVAMVVASSACIEGSSDVSPDLAAPSPPVMQSDEDHPSDVVNVTGGDAFSGAHARTISPLRGRSLAWEPGAGFVRAEYAGGYYLDLELRAGDTLRSVTPRLFGNGRADALFHVIAVSELGAQTIIATVGVQNAAGPMTPVPMNVIDTTLAPGAQFVLMAIAGEPGLALGAIDVSFD